MPDLSFPAVRNFLIHNLDCLTMIAPSDTVCSMTKPKLPLFCQGDLDGFFGLFVDNLVQMLLIVQLTSLCGISAQDPLLLHYILPGVAVSILLGNVFYAWQARRLARTEGRDDVTALPYGINTPSLLVYIFFVMLPVYARTGDPRLAWQMGLIACLGSGIIELAGSLVAERIRQHTPRAALLSTLAGIAIGFIAMTFALQIFQRPLIAMLPLAVVMVTYFARFSFPWGLPGGLIAVALGTLCAWILPWILPPSPAWPAMSATAVAEAWTSRGIYLPRFAGGAIWEVLRQPSEWVGYLSVIIPMGLFNVIGSLQNVESAEASGDRFATGPSLAVNGLGTIVAALLGSCFPTTIYIGHPGWKELGARAGYSTLNGIVVCAICLTGTVTVVSRIVPLEAGIAIVLWIGIIITAQAFQTTSRSHAPAVAIGLFPAIAAWGATVVQGAFIAAGGGSAGAATLQSLLTDNPQAEVNGFLIHGLITVERGYIFTCMLLSAIAAWLIEQRFFRAAAWSLVAAALAVFGLTHAYQLSGNNIDYSFLFTRPASDVLSFHPWGIAAGYVMFASLCAACGYASRNKPSSEERRDGPKPDEPT
jgi:AGZA family xanthine/uracil permease-like MFS transporter